MFWGWLGHPPLAVFLCWRGGATAKTIELRFCRAHQCLDAIGREGRCRHHACRHEHAHACSGLCSSVASTAQAVGGPWLRQPGMALVNAAPRMRTKRRCLPLLLLAFGIPSSVDASCESYAATLSRINTEEKESYKKARKEFVEEKCGPESQSWIGGAAGRNRFQYLNCKLTARNSEKFKNEWAMKAVVWESRRKQVDTASRSLGCSD